MTLSEWPLSRNMVSRVSTFPLYVTVFETPSPTFAKWRLLCFAGGKFLTVWSCACTSHPLKYEHTQRILWLRRVPSITSGCHSLLKCVFLAHSKSVDKTGPLFTEVILTAKFMAIPGVHCPSPVTGTQPNNIVAAHLQFSA